MSEREDILQKQLDASTKWVGLYIATASVACALAMAADIFHGVRSKKFWFPSKFFSLNATFLTLLAVAMKPAMDLSEQLYKDGGYFSKVSSVTFMCMSMVHFISSLGSMSDHEILTNTIALGILVLTVVGNMWIQVIQLVNVVSLHKQLYGPTIWVLVLLVILVSASITTPNIKRSLELKYQEIHKLALKEEHGVTRNEKFTVSNQKEAMKKYWVMAETSNPQFVLARSVVSTTSSVICLLATFYIAKRVYGIYSWIPSMGMMSAYIQNASAYKWSSSWIIAIQSVGITIGLVAPMLRWFHNVRIKCSTTRYTSLIKEFNIESYWIQTLVDWRDDLPSLQISSCNLRKYFHGAKWLVLTIVIGVQILVVLLSKLVVFICVLVMTPLVACFVHVRRFLVFVSVLLTTYVMQHSPQVTNSNDQVAVELGVNIPCNMSSYVLLLEGEPELPEMMVKRICHQADKVIRLGKRQQPTNLIKLLSKFENFSGVRKFDSLRIPCLHSQEPHNCWTLPLVTLTGIAIALPNVANRDAKQLLSSVDEGMSLARLIDEALDINGELVNVRKAANVAWASVVLYKKWQNINLHKSSFSCKNSEKILRNLSNKAELIVTRYLWGEVEDIIMENPLNWPVKVIAANSMYRVCQTVLLSIQGEEYPTDESLFEQLYMMIADVFAACLTNLPHIISSMCHQSGIEKREKSVREAFLLLGKTEGILEHLQQREWPSRGPGYKLLSIDEWRALF